MSTFEPGQVAVATVRGVPNVRVFRSDAWHDTPWHSANPIGSWGSYHPDHDVTDIRSLVVLDLDGIAPESIVAGLRSVDGGTNSTGWARVADQIEAQTKPPRIPEPTGLGAVVEDRDGTRWSLIGTHRPGLWRADRELSMQVEWALIDVARVLSEGVAS